MLVVFGVDQALRIRSRNRWRPIREMLTERFVNLSAADELLTALCEEFCKRSWGHSAYPDGETYFTLLPQVLARPATWAPDAFGVYVFEQIRQEGDDTEQTLAGWGSVLISERGHRGHRNGGPLKGKGPCFFSLIPCSSTETLTGEFGRSRSTIAPVEVYESSVPS
jgi:hypothetical protein